MTTAKIIVSPKRGQKGDITEIIKTVDDAYEWHGVPPGEAAVISVHPNLAKFLGNTEAFLNLCAVTDALNEGEVFDYADASQKKWQPWLKYIPGSGFSLLGVIFALTHSYVGARLSLKNEKLAQYAATQFPHLYNALFKQ